MTEVHKVEEFAPGDTWKISGPMLDEHGEILPLTGALVEWALVDRRNAPVIEVSTVTGEVTITDADAGEVEVLLAPAVTATIPRGDYRDYLRVTIADTVSTMWRGPIKVVFSPFD